MLKFDVVRSLDELSEVTELARLSHSESRFSYMAFSESKVKKLLSDAVLNTARHGVFIARLNGRAVGFASCSVGEYHICQGALIATIHNLNVLAQTRASLTGGRAGLGLLKGTLTWAKARSASEVLLHVTSGVDLPRIHKFAKHAGAKLIGGSYAFSEF